MQKLAVIMTFIFLTSCGQSAENTPSDSRKTHLSKSILNEDLSPNYYYGESFSLDNYKTKKDAGKSLIKDLEDILNLKHIIKDNSFHEIVEECPKNTRCLEHQIYSYRDARIYLFEKIAVDTLFDNKYVEDKYCGRFYFDGEKVGDQVIYFKPGKIPNPNIMNTEHIWPKARFEDIGSKEQNYIHEYDMKVADLHHLIPTDSKVNGKRANHFFGEVTGVQKYLTCNESKLGYLKDAPKKYDHILFFEPPESIKGNIARALFYFAVKYELPIDDQEEYFLKKWHQQDPVDEKEVQRNNLVYKFQNTRNPFIDFPSLVDMIDNF